MSVWFVFVFFIHSSENANIHYILMPTWSIRCSAPTARRDSIAGAIDACCATRSASVVSLSIRQLSLSRQCSCTSYNPPILDLPIFQRRTRSATCVTIGTMSQLWPGKASISVIRRCRRTRNAAIYPSCMAIVKVSYSSSSFHQSHCTIKHSSRHFTHWACFAFWQRCCGLLTTDFGWNGGLSKALLWNQFCIDVVLDEIISLQQLALNVRAYNSIKLRALNLYQEMLRCCLANR